MEIRQGSNNTGIGSQALYANTTGAGSTAVGYQAGNAITTGTGNTLLGFGTAASAVSGNYQIVLGYNTLSYGDNHLTFGSSTGSDRVYNGYGTNASWTRVSDERYKENITPNSDCGLSFINDLNPITYTWKAKADIDPSLPDYDETKLEPTYDKKMYGLIAQEVKESLDKHNITDFGGWSIEDKSSIQGISQEMFVHPLIKAVQELSAKVEELEDKLNNKE